MVGNDPHYEHLAVAKIGRCVCLVCVCVCVHLPNSRDSQEQGLERKGQEEKKTMGQEGQSKKP